MHVFFLFVVAGHPVLYSSLVVEKLGGGQDPGTHDGSGPGHHIRGREAAEEETSP